MKIFTNNCLKSPQKLVKYCRLIFAIFYTFYTFQIIISNRIIISRKISYSNLNIFSRFGYASKISIRVFLLLNGIIFNFYFYLDILYEKTLIRMKKIINLENILD